MANNCRSLRRGPRRSPAADRQRRGFQSGRGCKVGCHELHQARMAGDRGRCDGRGRRAVNSGDRAGRPGYRTPRPRYSPLPAAMGCCTTSPTGHVPTGHPGGRWSRTRSTTRTSTATSRRCCPDSTFEVNTVLADPKLAGMEVSIQWPYGSNLHCEILVDDQIVAQADQFIAPRLFRPKDDPLYGVLQCGAPLDTPVAGQTAATTGPGAPPASTAPPPPAA